MPRTKDQSGSMVRRLERFGAQATTVAHHLGRAAAHPAADRAGRQGDRHRPLRVGRLHLRQRRARDPREVRGVRPRRPLLRRAQGRRRRWRHGRRAARLGHQPRPRARGGAVRQGPARRVAALRRPDSTRSTASSCRGPTSPPRPSSPACRTWAGRWTTSRPTAPCARLRRQRTSATPSRAATFDAVVFTSSSTVRNLVGIAGKPHPSTVIACIGPATAKTAEECGLRVDVLAPEPSADEPRRRPRRPRPFARADGCGGWRGAMRPSQKRPTARRRAK